MRSMIFKPTRHLFVTILCAMAVALIPAASAQSAHEAITLEPPAGWDFHLQSTGRDGEALTPPPKNFRRVGEGRAGVTGDLHTMTLRFAVTTRLTKISSSRDFTVEQGGTCVEGNVFHAGERCSLLVRFTPRGAGRRLGRITIEHTASARPLEVGLTGTGFEPALSFVPAVIATVPGSYPSGQGLLAGAQNLAVDGGDTLYVADTGNNAVRMMNSSGSFTTISSSATAPLGVAADSFGEVWFTEPAANVIYGIDAYGPQAQQSGNGSDSCTYLTPCNLYAEEVHNPGPITITSNDTMYFDESESGLAVSQIQPNQPTLVRDYDPFVYQDGGPKAMTVDEDDNIYSAWINTGICQISSQTLYDSQSGNSTNRKVAGGRLCGFSGDGGQARNAEIGASLGQFALDAAGNLYFTDTANQRVRRIDRTSGIIRTIAGTGTAGYTGDGGPATAATLKSPTGVAVDSQGRVYVISSTGTTGTAQVIRKIGPTGILNFGSQALSLAVPAQTVLVTNTGNADMELTRTVTNGANPGDFTIDPNTTTCMLTSGATLPVGQSCRFGVVFAPKGIGPRSANLVLLDNTDLGTDTIQLTGGGVLSEPVVSFLSPLSGQSYTSNFFTAKVSVYGVSGIPLPTGPVQLSLDGTKVTPENLQPNGVASFPLDLESVKPGTHKLTATYNGDSNYAAVAPVSVSFTLKAAPVAPTKVVLAAATGSSLQCNTAAFTVKASSASGTLPTGRVALLDGAKLIASGPLVKGKATLRTNLSGLSAAVLIAHYGGDAGHLPGNSAALKLATLKPAPCK